MAVPTIDQVRAILPSETTLTDEQIQAAIDGSQCVVEQAVAGCASSLSDACQTQMGIYLAAHFAAVTENTLSLHSETDPCCGGSAVYGFEFGTGVLGTPYGQMANMISCGCLHEFDMRPVSFVAIGTIGSSPADYLPYTGYSS